MSFRGREGVPNFSCEYVSYLPFVELFVSDDTTIDPDGHRPRPFPLTEDPR